MYHLNDKINENSLDVRLCDVEIIAESGFESSGYSYDTGGGSKEGFTGWTKSRLPGRNPSCFVRQVRASMAIDIRLIN
jgi:hypothetical protein